MRHLASIFVSESPSVFGISIRIRATTAAHTYTQFDFMFAHAATISLFAK